MSCIDVPVSEPVLLTGSGFTKNFGGLLANEMWKKINNNLDDILYNDNLNKLEQNNRTHLKNLIKLTKNDFDYEKIFEKVMKGDKYSKEEKDTKKDNNNNTANTLTLFIPCFSQETYINIWEESNTLAS